MSMKGTKAILLGIFLLLLAHTWSVPSLDTFTRVVACIAAMYGIYSKD